MTRVIAISQRVDSFPDRGETRDALDQALCRLVLAAGHIPVPVPNVLSDRRADLGRWITHVRPEALILSGGNDLGQCPERDATELHLLEFASFWSWPVLGLCRGMQVMAHRAGVGLRRVDGHVRTRHRLEGELRHEVNSYHNFAIERCPDHYRVTARSEDGQIEAIAHETLPWEGWMWHPEREDALRDWEVAYVDALLSR